MLSKLVRSERGPFFTLNVTELKAEEASWLRRYTDIAETNEHYRDTGVKPKGRSGLSQLVTEFEDELVVMAKVQGYFQVAARVSCMYLDCTCSLYAIHSDISITFHY